MISKEYFCKMINWVKKYTDELENLPDWIQFESFPLANMGYDILDDLGIEMGIPEDNSDALGILFDWCFEHKFGTEYKPVLYYWREGGGMKKYDEPQPGSLVEVAGKVYAPKNAEELYDCIAEIWKK